MQILIWLSSATWCRADDVKPGDVAIGDKVEYHSVPDDFTDDECSDLARERSAEAA